MATGVGRGRICLRSFSSPIPKPPTRRNNLGDISYTSQVIADFVRVYSEFKGSLLRHYQDLKHCHTFPGCTNLVS